MSIPKKRKNNIQIYRENQLTERRQELLDKITKSDTYLPDSILHDDLDRGMLDYVKNNFKIVSDGDTVPVIDKILTIQRWSEFSENWQFSNEDGNMELPFIATVRRPEVQLGTNPSVQRTIPDRHQFYYASVPTWDGTKMGADIYTIPQPIPVDITYEVFFVCTKFRDLNKFNRVVLQNFASRQDYTVIKGHYVPLILDAIEDGSPLDTLDGRRFYLQTYRFIMMGFLIDSDEFEVKPAVSRLFTMFEFLKNKTGRKKYMNKSVDVTVVTLIGDSTQLEFSVGESIGTLFNVYIDGVLQTKDVDFFHIAYTSKITFVNPPPNNSKITIQYYRGRNNVILDNTGKVIQFTREEFIYDGTEDTDIDGNPIFEVINTITDVVTVEINGLAEQEELGFRVVGSKNVNLLGKPLINSKIGISYLY